VGNSGPPPILGRFFILLFVFDCFPEEIRGSIMLYSCILRPFQLPLVRKRFFTMSIIRFTARSLLLCGIGICVVMASVSGYALAQEGTRTTVDPTGTWRWEYDLDGTHYKDLVRLKLGANIKDSKDKEVKGVYESSAGRKIEIRNGKISGTKLTFDFNLNYQGMDVKLEFDGTITKDELSGDVSASTGSDGQDFPWAATRSVQADDVVGVWKMRIDANGTILEPIATVTKDGDSLKATYTSVNESGKEVRIDAKNVKIEKNQLCFAIETEFQGTSLQAEFRGRPYGDKIDGMIDYVLGGNAGEIDFTGARQSDTK
jgi:hypothetical protein